MVWPIEDILAYLDEHAITLVTNKGIPSLAPQKQLKPHVLARVLQHVKARRVELIAWFDGMRNVQVAKTRERVLAELTQRAVDTGKTLYILSPRGMSFDISESLTKAERKEADESRYACVAGDQEWTRLPDE